MNQIDIAAFKLAMFTPSLLFRRWRKHVLHIANASPTIIIAAGLLAALASQIQAQVAPGTPDVPGVTQTTQPPVPKTPLDLVLRFIAVLEWTGPEGNPDSSLLIPVAIYTDDRYQDADNYLAAPVPLAVQSGTQYILQRRGEPVGSYDLNAAGKLRGEWFASGTWKPLNAPNPYANTASQKHPDNASNSSGDSGRPPFTADNAGSNGKDLPTLHLRPPKNAPKLPPPDQYRPVMAYGNPPVKLLPNFGPNGASTAAPAWQNAQEMVAVSDTAARKATNWAYPWPSTAEKTTMQQQMQMLARTILQRSIQAKAAADTAAAARKAAAEQAADKPAPKLMKRPEAPPASPKSTTNTSPAAALPPLNGLDFRCFSMTQAKNPAKPVPTCVWSGQSPPGENPTRFVTVIAQPDIYGVPQAISQSITDASQLATNPRVHLVDVLDAAANNQEDFLFEIDGPSDRQFGIYVLTGGKVKLAYVTPKLPF